MGGTIYNPWVIMGGEPSIIHGLLGWGTIYNLRDIMDGSSIYNPWVIMDREPSIIHGLL